MLRSSRRHDLTAVLASAGAEVDDPVRVRDHVEVMLDDEHRPTLVEQLLEDAHEHTHILGVQAHRRFVEDEEGVLLRLPEFGGELEPLRLTTGQCRGRLVEGEVSEPHILQRPQPGVDLTHRGEVGERLGDGHRQQIRQRQRLTIGI